MTPAAMALLALLPAWESAGSGEVRSRASGVIVGPGQEAVAAARVETPGRSEAPATTDAEGRFELEYRGLPPVLLRVEAPGFVPATVVWIGEEPLRIALTPVSSAETVTAARAPGVVTPGA
jgi:hypothetical protein